MSIEHSEKVFLQNFLIQHENYPAEKVGWSNEIKIFFNMNKKRENMNKREH